MSAPARPTGRAAAARRRPTLRPSLRRTILAFALAPGIGAAACVGSLALPSMWDPSWVHTRDMLAVVAMTAAASGYAAAAVFGIPLYLLIPPRFRGPLIAMMPLGAVSAAAPWLLVFALSPFDREFSLAMARFALAFGVVGGLAFWAIRRDWRRG